MSATRCAACRYLRRRCAEDCVLAPFFPATHPERFAYVHAVFGAGNVARMLQHLTLEQRLQASEAMAMEAYWRMRDPVYGSAGVISILQRQIRATQREIAETQAQLAMHAVQLEFRQNQNQNQQLLADAAQVRQNQVVLADDDPQQQELPLDDENFLLNPHFFRSFDHPPNLQ